MTFTFTMDAFPDYTKYDRTKKVLCMIRVLQETTVEEDEIVAVDADLNEPADAGGRGYSWKNTGSTVNAD